MSSSPMAGVGDFSALDRQGQQKAWNWYDWANSAFYTTVLTAFFAPYMATVAGNAAGCSPDEACSRTVSLFGIGVAAGSLPSYLVSFATIFSAFLLPIVGTFVDRSARKKYWMSGFAWAGAGCASLMFFMKGDFWQIGAFAVVSSSVLAGCSLVAYYAILVDISNEEERDRVSARGWAFGYLGGGLLLLLNFVIFLFPGVFGIDKAMAVRIALLSAALWWGAFTIIPFVKLRNYQPRNVTRTEGGIIKQSFGQFVHTAKDMKNYPMTLTFLLAYLFYNDGLQTVIASAALYGDKELKIPQTVLFGTILLIQFMAFFGAIFFGKFAEKHGSYRPILYGVYGWMAIVVIAMMLPAVRENHNNALPITLFLLTGALIAIVMGGTQALSRSFFSLLIPRGREGEYFGFYNAVERGTSWFGTFLFGLTFQLTSSYRYSIVALIIFFVLGVFFLLRLDPRKGIADAGNRVPSVV